MKKRQLFIFAITTALLYMGCQKEVVNPRNTTPTNTTPTPTAQASDSAIALAINISDSVSGTSVIKNTDGSFVKTVTKSTADGTTQKFVNNIDKFGVVNSTVTSGGETFEATGVIKADGSISLTRTVAANETVDFSAQYILLDPNNSNITWTTLKDKTTTQTNVQVDGTIINFVKNTKDVVQTVTVVKPGGIIVTDTTIVPTTPIVTPTDSITIVPIDTPTTPIDPIITLPVDTSVIILPVDTSNLDLTDVAKGLAILMQPVPINTKGDVTTNTFNSDSSVTRIVNHMCGATIDEVWTTIAKTDGSTKTTILEANKTVPNTIIIGKIKADGSIIGTATSSDFIFSVTIKADNSFTGTGFNSTDNTSMELIGTADGKFTETLIDSKGTKIQVSEKGTDCIRVKTKFDPSGNVIEVHTENPDGTITVTDGNGNPITEPTDTTVIANPLPVDTVVTPPLVAPNVGDLIITGFSPISPTVAEFVRIKNNSSQDVILSNLYLAEEEATDPAILKSFKFLGGIDDVTSVIGAGETLVLIGAGKDTDFKTTYPNFYTKHRIVELSSSVGLTNGGDEIYIIHKAAPSVAIDKVAWTSSSDLNTTYYGGATASKDLMASFVNGVWNSESIEGVIEPAPTGPSFKTDIQPILNKSCAQPGCHTGSTGQALGEFASYPDVKKDATSGILKTRVVTAKNMPIGGFTLTEQERTLIGEWIDSGALDN